MAEIRIDATSERDELLNSIRSKLEGEDKFLVVRLQWILDLIDKYSVPANWAVRKDEPATLFPTTGRTKKLKPVSFLRKLFTENPDKEYSMGDIKQMFVESSIRGELIIRAKSTNATAYTAVRVLERQNFIMRVASDSEELIFKKQKKIPVV